MESGVLRAVDVELLVLRHGRIPVSAGRAPRAARFTHRASRMHTLFAQLGCSQLIPFGPCGFIRSMSHDGHYLGVVFEEMAVASSHRCPRLICQAEFHAVFHTFRGKMVVYLEEG
jgi:hypothetical protein